MSTQAQGRAEYTIESGRLIANVIKDLNDKAKVKGTSFVETYTLKKGLNKFGDQGYEASHGEMKQLHDRSVFKPINVSNLTPQEKKRSMESLIFLVEKHECRIKARTCANGSIQ